MEQMQMNMPDIYDAALYLRLSKDDMEEGDGSQRATALQIRESYFGAL